MIFLNFQSLVVDMILMGIVKSTHQTHLYVSLPGKLFGRVPIANISKSYTDFVQTIIENQDLTTKPKTLPELFSVGQIVYVKVLDKCHGEEQNILLSMLPSDINSEVPTQSLVEGNVIMCAVQEEEDHGYLLESGLKNIRTFMPKKYLKGNSLSIGEHIYCKIQKSTDSTLTVSMFKKNELNKIDTLDVPNLKTLMPGCVIDFNIARLLKNGVEGLLFDGSVSGYVNELNMPSKYSLNDPELIGKEMKARILYTMPFSNQIFATLIIDHQKGKAPLKFGTLIQDAKVIKQTSSGVLFKLKENARAFLPRNMIVKNLKKNFDIESAMMKFSPNSTHELRVMDYNVFDDCYHCTNDKNLIKEKYFGTFDLTLGQFAQAKVTEKIENGYRVKIGNVNGLLKGALMNPTAKLTVGNDIKVRIAEIDHDGKIVHVTNLKGFLTENANVLTSRKSIKFQEGYSGVVVRETDKLYIILFFNHIKAAMIKNEETENEILSIGGLKVGSVKNFVVKSVKGDRITVGIPKIINTTHLGQIFKAKVTSILPSGLQVYVDELKMNGKIPISFLSEFSKLANLIHGNIKENEIIEVVSLGNNLFSRRDVEYYKSGVIDDFNNLVPGDILRCNVKSTEADNIELECFLKNYNQSIKLNRNAFDKPEEVDLNPGDIVYVSVISKTESHNNSLYVTPSLHKVWKNEMELPLNMLKSYLNDVDYVLEKQKKAGKLFCKYSIGQRVSGKVKSNIGKNLLIEIEDGVHAQGMIENIQTFKVGGMIKDAVVVWIDPINSMIHVTLKEKCKDEISIDQKIDMKLINEKKHKSIVVFFNEFVTITSIRKSNQPLIYVPTKLHYNDFSSVTNRALGNASSKLVIKKSTEKHLLGIFVHDFKIFLKMDKFISKLGKRNADKLENVPKKLTKVDLDDVNDDEEERKTETEDESEDEIQTTKSLKENSKVLKMSEKSFAKSIKGTLKKTKMRVPLKKKILSNKDSLLDDNVVNLVSYKKFKEGEQKPQKNIEKMKNKKKSFVGKIKSKRLTKKN